jgi:hypothetical protein
MGRPPERIEKVLNEIRKKWHQYPDLRLGQLLINAIPTNLDLYYIEDDELCKDVKEYPREI